MRDKAIVFIIYSMVTKDDLPPGATLMLNLIEIKVFIVGKFVFIQDPWTITNSVYSGGVTRSEIRLLPENITVTRNINFILWTRLPVMVKLYLIELI